MTYGIVGNTRKEALWAPLSELLIWMQSRNIPFRLHPDVVQGVIDRGFSVAPPESETGWKDVDTVLSFGGDGTLLAVAHAIGVAETPILGVNVGRLGFLSAVEVADVQQAISVIERGEHTLERRSVLEAVIETPEGQQLNWALNDVVIAKSTTASMIEVTVHVDELFLNDYWADGLIIATPTGSTAYSLAAGGPLLAPGSGVIVLTPIAPHTLTTRPIVLRERSKIMLHVKDGDEPFLLACDGRSQQFDPIETRITVRPAEHNVVLVTLPQTDYFSTVRSKLRWGTR